MNVPQQTMRRLAKDNRIVYFDLPCTLPGFLKSLFKPGGGRYRSGIKEVAPNISVVALPPVLLPSNAFPAWLAKPTGAINGWILTRLLNRLLARLGIDAYTLWIYGVWAEVLLGGLAPETTIYDCIDEWAGYFPEGATKENIKRMDRVLFERSDIVFVGSAMLLQTKGHLNPRTYHVRHAADFANFSRAAWDETPVPEDIARLAKPVIGLAGVLEKRVDREIIETLAKSHPEWSIALVGPVWSNLDITALEKLPNIHFLGKKEVTDLPGYIKGFDVCMIPYIIDEFTLNIYPLKLHEYLASGKPVVSTPIPAVVEQEGLVRIASTPAEFLTAVEAAVAESDPGLKQRRIQCASENTWDDRVSRKLALLSELRGGAA